MAAFTTFFAAILLAVWRGVGGLIFSGVGAFIT
jgi:hypothetical protein